MEEMYRQVMWEGAQSFQALSRHTTLPKSPRLPTQNLSKLRPFGVLWRFHYIGLIDSIIDHWQTEFNLQPLGPPQRWGRLVEIPTL